LDLLRVDRCTGDVKTLIALAVAVALTGLAGTARAAGGPLFNDSGGLRGILAPSGYRYVTTDGRNGTSLMRIAPDLHVAAYRTLPGRYTIPAVAMDRTTSGLSADGKTLILVQPRFRFGRQHTRFLILSLPGMHVRAAVTLPGDFTFDAMTPDASVLYFIHYLSKRDPTRYEVRAFDTKGPNLVPGAIVDRSEPDEEMRGYPVSRVTSADGRYAYTLYDGGGNTPFVHVLDTIGGRAHCVDLDELAGRQDLYSFRLRREPSGDVTVLLHGSPVLLVHKASFAVSKPNALSTDGRRRLWAPIGAGAAAILTIAAISLVLVRRRRPATT
jgi:hypothetical protein